jgi:hypothetical protein
MKLFLSWSGERSKILADSLYRWLPGVINAVDPWLSSSDIDPGSRWGVEIAEQLENTRYGIICVTADNLNAPWLLFEAGALSKYVKKSRVVPLLLDNKPAEIKGPLAQFQAIQASRDDIKKLIIGINLTVLESGEKGLEKTFLDEAFELWWPKLQLSLESIPRAIDTVKRNERSQREMIEELLILVRNLAAKLERLSVPLSQVSYDSSPPDNFPDDWETQWQPSFEDLGTATKESNAPKKSKPAQTPRK